MQYTYLGRTGLQVSRLCLGTMNFGPRTTEPDSFAIMDKALDLGINFFDSANRYGAGGSEGMTDYWGATEEIIGKWFAQGGGRRDKVVLATKLYGEMGPWPNEGKLSALNIKRACEASLKRLQTDHIDLYQMHHIDRDTPWEEIWQGMEQLVKEGKILYVGSSNFAGWHIAQANEIAKSRHFLGLVSEQSKYHLAERMIEMDVIPACEAYGVGIIPWSPLGGGILGGMAKNADKVRRATEHAQQNYAKVQAQVAQYEAVCAEWGEEPAAIALAWLLHQPIVTAPIIGPRTMEQLTGASQRALEITLSQEQLDKLDAIWPGYKTSPEQYAW